MNGPIIRYYTRTVVVSVVQYKFVNKHNIINVNILLYQYTASTNKISR